MITSSSNQKVKQVVQWQTRARERREAGIFLAEGFKLYQEAPEEDIREVYATPDALERAGITVRFFRPPMGLTDRGCSYAVRVSGGNYPAAMELLRQEGLAPMRVFYAEGGGALSEITM